MKKVLPWLVPALAVLYILSGFTFPAQIRGYDLRAFGSFPVLWNGRICPIDTVARNTLLLLRSKQTLRQEGQSVNALEWLLAMVSQPARADEWKTFVIDDPDVLGAMGLRQRSERYYSFNTLRPFLDTLEQQAQQAAQIDPHKRSRYQSNVFDLQERILIYERLQNTFHIADSSDFPAEIQAYEKIAPAGLGALTAHQSSSHFDRQALQAVTDFFERYRFLDQAAYFRPLAPFQDAEISEWSTVGNALLEMLRTNVLHPSVMTYASMLQAYRELDPGPFNASIAEYQRWLSVYAPSAARRSTLEAWFNHAEPFYKGILLYVSTLLLLFFSWLVWPQTLKRTALRLLWVAFILHTVALVSRIVIQGRPPVTNLYSSAIFVGWVVVLLGLVLEHIWHNALGALVAAVIGSLTLIIAHHLANGNDTLEVMRAVLDSNFWLGTHVVAVTIGYSSTFLAGFLAEVFILGGVLSSRLKKETGRTLVQMTYGVVCFSLLFSFVGTMLGGIWADQSWGRFWGWDPKENGALLIVLWNAIILHVWFARYVERRGLMMMAAFGNILTSLSWFGVNMLGIGLHSYGFMDKAFSWLIAFILIQAAVIALGALPARYWRSPDVLTV